MIVKAYCNASKKKKNGEAPILIRISLNSNRKFISTGKYIKPDYFNNSTGYPKRNYQHRRHFDAFIDESIQKIKNIAYKLEDNNETVTFEKIFERLNNQAEGDNFIKWCYREHENQKKHLKKDSADMEIYFFRKLTEFKSDLSFNDISREMVEDFDFNMQNQNLKKNSRVAYLIYLRKYTNIAYEKGLISVKPFKGYQVNQEEVLIDYLNPEQVNHLQNIYDKEVLPWHLHNTLFYFLIGCYTGLRYKDIGALIKNIHTGDIKDNYYIHDNKIVIQTQKRQTPTYIPLSKRAKRMIDNKPFQLIPVASKASKYLKIIAEKAELDKNLKFHSSRHTFAILCLYFGISIEIVSDLLAHKSLKTTQRYAKIVDEVKSKEFEKFDQYFS